MRYQMQRPSASCTPASPPIRGQRGWQRVGRMRILKAFGLHARRHGLASRRRTGWRLLRRTPGSVRGAVTLPAHPSASRPVSAPRGTLDALADENRRYEARFGHVFLISASGRTAGEILSALRQRMSNDPSAEIEVAAAEHRKITRLRLQRMLAA